MQKGKKVMLGFLAGLMLVGGITIPVQAQEEETVNLTIEPRQDPGPGSTLVIRWVEYGTVGSGNSINGRSRMNITVTGTNVRAIWGRTEITAAGRTNVGAAINRTSSGSGRVPSGNYPSGWATSPVIGVRAVSTGSARWTNANNGITFNFTALTGVWSGSRWQ